MDVFGILDRDDNGFYVRRQGRDHRERVSQVDFQKQLTHFQGPETEDARICFRKSLSERKILMILKLF